MIFTKYLGPDVYSPSETRKLHRLPVNGRGKNIIYLEVLLLLLFIIIIYLSVANPVKPTSLFQRLNC